MVEVLQDFCQIFKGLTILFKKLKDFTKDLKGFWSKSQRIIVKISKDFGQNPEGFFGQNPKGFS